MTPLYKPFIVLCVAVIIATTAQPSASGAPSFTTQDDLRFTFPLPNGTAGPLFFLLFSTEGDVPNVSVQLRQVKSPDGALLPAESVTPRLDSNTITPKGVKVGVTLDPKFFTFPGEYRITLFFQSQTGTPSAPVTLIVNRPAADINLEELTGQTVSLTRWCPLCSASNDFLLYLRENTGKIALENVQVVGQNVYVKDTKELAPGEVRAELLPDDGSRNGGTQASIAPGAVGRVKVSLSQLRYAGAFDTGLLVSSPNLGSRKIVPLKVTVHDLVIYPFIAIALGVFGAFWTRRLAHQVQPQNENSLRLLQLENEIERFREVVRKPSSIEIVQSLRAQLNSAKESNELGDFAAVRDALTRIQEKLDAFRTAQVQAEGEAQTNLTALRNQVDVLAQDGTLTAEETTSLTDKLSDAERLLRDGMVEDVQIKLENIKQLLADLKKRKFAEYFKTLQGELANLSLSGDALTTSKTLTTEIQTLLAGNDLDNVRAKLEELKHLIETEKERATPRAARETDETLAAELPDVPTLTSVAPFAHIEVVTPPEQRIAGATINFTIANPETIIQPGDKFRWFFGDVGSFEEQKLSTSHRYQESGRFSVRVEIIRGGSVEETLNELVTIAPGRIEQARASLVRNILKNELILSIIALVLATIGGVIFLYSGKLFGTLVDYFMAILWGFGIDNSVKGFSAVLARISGPEG